MAVDFSYFSGLIAALLSCVMLGITLTEKQDNARASYLKVMLVCFALYTLSAGHTSVSETLTDFIWWNRLAYMGVCLAIGFLILFVVHYCFYSERDKIGKIWWLVLTPYALTVVGQWSYPATTLFYNGIDQVLIDGQIEFVSHPGPLFFYHMITVALGIFFCALILIASMWRDRGSRVMVGYSKLIIAITLPFFVFLAKVQGFISTDYDPTPIAFFLTTPLLLWTLKTDGLIDELSIGEHFFFQKSPMPSLIFSSNQRLLALNEQACDLLGSKTTKLYNASWREMRTRHRRLLGKLPKTLKSKAAKSIKVSGKKGPDRFFEFSCVELPQEQSSRGGYLVSFLDVTAIQQDVVSLKTEVTLDTLTGALNKKYWWRDAKNALSHAQSMQENWALLLLDLDHFKSINDTYGHLAGDKVLKLVANFMLANTRDNDIVGRYGGEEFCVWLRCVTQQEALILAEKLRAGIQNLSIETANGDINITTSIGICTAETTASSSLTELVDHADTALYKAKDAGRNRVVLHSNEA